MWAIDKSPLNIGAALDPDKMSKSSLSLLSNKEVIAISQDPLAKHAQLVRRHTEEEWDVWLSDLSASRQILGIANWKNDSQSVSVDLKTLSIASATARNPWSAEYIGTVTETQTFDLAGHELRLWVLSDIVTTAPLQSTTYHSAPNASLSGPVAVAACTSEACLPVGGKVENIGPGAGISFNNVTAQTSGTKLISIDFANYD